MYSTEVDSAIKLVLTCSAAGWHTLRSWGKVFVQPSEQWQDAILVIEISQLIIHRGLRNKPFLFKRHILRRITKAGGAFAIVVFLLSASSINAQVTFAEDCFMGEVQTGGHRTIGSLIGGSFNIKWEEGFILRRDYAFEVAVAD